MAHTTNFPMNALEEVFGEQLITCRLWPPKSPDVNLCNIYLLGNLSEQLRYFERTLT